MITAFGPAEKQIFDIVHRRFPICSRLDSEDADKRREARKQLSSGGIETSIRLALLAEHEAVQGIIEVLDQYCLRWMKEAGGGDYFQAPERRTMGEALGLLRHDDDALIRLLSLKLLRCNVNSSGEIFAYHWTYLGKLVLAKLGYRGLPEQSFVLTT